MGVFQITPIIFGKEEKRISYIVYYQYNLFSISMAMWSIIFFIYNLIFNVYINRKPIKN